MKALFVASSLLILVSACSSGTTGTGNPSSKTGNSVNSGNGSSNSGGTRSSNTGSSSGEACSSGSDCTNWACCCDDGAVVNSQSCVQHSCAPPSDHCPKACAQFSHGGWSGSATSSGASGSSGSGSSGSGSGSSSGASGGCTSQSDCLSFECGCTNGSRITVRDCSNGQCRDAYSGCQSACSDSGRGDWDGT